MPKQRRVRGRPKRNWMEGIKKAMHERNLKEGQWEDRKQWSLGVGQRRKTFWNRYTYIQVHITVYVLQFQLGQYALLDLPLFTDLSLKAHDVLGYLSNLFIISALQNRTAVHRQFRVLACCSWLFWYCAIRWPWTVNTLVLWREVEIKEPRVVKTRLWRVTALATSGGGGERERVIWRWLGGRERVSVSSRCHA